MPGPQRLSSACGTDKRQEARSGARKHRFSPFYEYKARAWSHSHLSVCCGANTSWKKEMACVTTVRSFRPFEPLLFSPFFSRFFFALSIISPPLLFLSVCLSMRTQVPRAQTSEFWTSKMGAVPATGLQRRPVLVPVKIGGCSACTGHGRTTSRLARVVDAQC